MIVGGYELHLYCRFANCEPTGWKDPNPPYRQSKGDFSNSTMGGAYHAARCHGWHFVKGDCICKRCWDVGRRHARHGDGILMR